MFPQPGKLKNFYTLHEPALTAVIFDWRAWLTYNSAPRTIQSRDRTMFARGFIGCVLIATLCSPLSAEVMLRYQFNEAEGLKIKDSSGHGFDGTLHIKAGENPLVKIADATALQFAADNDRIEAPFEAFPVQRGSLRLIIRFDDIEPPQTIWRIYSGNGDGMYLKLLPKGTLRFAYYHRAKKKWIGSEFKAGIIQEGFWHEIVAGWDFDGYMTLSLDGVIRGARYLGVKPHFAADSVMVFGNNHIFASPFRGAIRLIEISDTPPTVPLPERRAIQAGNLVRWRSGEFAVTFDDRYGLLQSVIFGSLKLVESDETTPLWEVELRADKGLGLPVTISSELAPRVRIEMQHDTCTLEWKDILIPTDTARLSVRVIISRYHEENMTSWRIEVDNPSKKFGIYHVVFPIMALRPLGESVAEHKLVVPLRWGEARPDAFGVTEKPMPPEIVYRCNYPGAHMQFAALTSPTAGATYIATYDGEARLKRSLFRVVPSRERIIYRLTQFPDNIAMPDEDYRQPFPLVFGHVKGDWFDVCKTYRRWALKQRWASRGALWRRTDIPEWYKRTAIVLRQSLTGKYDTVEANLKNSLRAAREIPGASMSVWYSWHKVDLSASAVPETRPGQPSLSAGAGWEWQAADGVAEAVHRMVAAGLHPTAYINTRLYDMTTDPKNHPYALWALRYVIRGIAGQPEFYNRQQRLWDMCRWTKGWQQRYLRNCETAMRAGFCGIYMDSFGRGNSICFAAKEHGHQRGGGNLCVEGQRRMAKLVREHIRAINPEAITTGEAPIEAFIDVLDGKLLHYNLPWNFAPLYTAVYHDYQLCYGRTVSLPAENPEPLFSMIVGRLFAEGVQIGRFFINHPDYRLWHESYREQLEYLKRCARAKLAAHDYLTLGEFMRPPHVINKLPTVETNYRNIHTVMPVVLVRAWKSPSGGVAHVLTNISLKSQTITYRFSTKDYGFPTNSRVSWRRIFPRTSAEPEILNAGECERTIHLQPHDVLIFELKPASAKEP